MDYLLTVLKTGAAIALLVIVFVGGPIWGMTGSLSRAWHAVREYAHIMGWLVAIGMVLGAAAAFTG